MQTVFVSSSIVRTTTIIPPTDPYAGWNNYTNSDYGIAFKFPSTIKVNGKVYNTKIQESTKTIICNDFKDSFKDPNYCSTHGGGQWKITYKTLDLNFDDNNPSITLLRPPFTLGHEGSCFTGDYNFSTRVIDEGFIKILGTDYDIEATDIKNYNPTNSLDESKSQYETCVTNFIGTDSKNLSLNTSLKSIWKNLSTDFITSNQFNEESSHIYRISNTIKLVLQSFVYIN